MAIEAQSVYTGWERAKLGKAQFSFLFAGQLMFLQDFWGILRESESGLSIMSAEWCGPRSGWGEKEREWPLLSQRDSLSLLLLTCFAQPPGLFDIKQCAAHTLKTPSWPFY